MVEITSAKCPDCGANLQLPQNLKKAHCMYCGAEVIIELKQPEQVHYHGVGTKENYIKLGYRALNDAQELIKQHKEKEAGFAGLLWNWKPNDIVKLKELIDESEKYFVKAIEIDADDKVALKGKDKIKELRKKFPRLPGKDAMVGQETVARQGCFIATAAYGTPMAKEIDILRNWRDKSLLRTKRGQMFVEIYYKTSPAIANFISKSDYLRAITRKLLIHW